MLNPYAKEPATAGRSLAALGMTWGVTLAVNPGITLILCSQVLLIKSDALYGTIFKTVVARSAATKQSSGLEVVNDYISFS